MVYHGSVEPLPGHIKVSTDSLRKFSVRGKTGWGINWNSIVDGIQPIPYRFCFYEGKVYYVNGRRQVYETNIFYRSLILFYPIGHQLISYTVWAPIQFRLMEKVEWVFL